MRLRRIAEDACRQSGRRFIPDIDFSPSIKEAISNFSPINHIGLFGDLAAKIKLSNMLKKTDISAKDFYIVVGPEGGLSAKDCEQLNQAGFFSITWAPYTLRSELASLAAIAIINAFIGRA